MWNKTLAVTSLIVLSLVAVLAARTLHLPSPRPQVEWIDDCPLDLPAAAERLAGAVRFPTVSFEERERIDPAAFLGLHDFLEASFPAAHALLEKELVGNLSLLYRWSGRDPDLEPVVLMAHQDVVPIEEASVGGWSFDPFAGDVVDGAVRGRGTLDDKSALLGLLEAVELLIGEGFAPRRTVYLAFGHDEEIGGWEGARRIAELLASRRVEPAFVLDEGGLIMRRALPGLDTPVALVGIAEKGHANFELKVEVAGGHSSVQQQETAIGVLSRAIARLDDHPLPARLVEPSRQMFLALGSRLPLPQRVVVANLGLFEPLLVRALAGSVSETVVRTTVAPTVIRAGVKPNVLPTEATAIVNTRILTGSTATSILDRIREIVDDPRVQVRLLEPHADPSPISSVEGAEYALIARSILEAAHLQDLEVAPFLMIGGTDCRHFVGLTPRIYRFMGALITPEDLPRMHGIDERIPVEDYARIVRIYYRLLRNLDTLQEHRVETTLS